MDKLIAIGDIHGHRKKLEKLIDQVQPTHADQVVFLGDYIDRGPDSRGVVDYLIQFSEQFPQTVFLRGNHEQLMLDALASTDTDRLPSWKRLSEFDPQGWNREIGTQRGDLQAWQQNGAWETLASYGAEEPGTIFWDLIPQGHIEFLARTKHCHHQEGYLFIHAGANELLPLDGQLATLLWNVYSPPGVKESHVVGHTPCPDCEPHFEPGRYNLDTGAGWGHQLTACNVLTREYWQA